MAQEKEIEEMVVAGGLGATLHINRVKEIGAEGKDPGHHTIQILGTEGKDPDHLMIRILGAEGKDPDHQMRRVQTEDVGSVARSVPRQLPAMGTIDQTSIRLISECSSPIS